MSEPIRDDDARLSSLEAELAEIREALRASQAELHDLRSSLTFRGAHALSRRFHALAPSGTRRARAFSQGRAILRFFFRWRLAFPSRAAREDLRGLLRGLRRPSADAPEIRHVHPSTAAPVFTIEEWDGAPVLHEADVEDLLKGLWAAARIEGSVRAS